MVQNSKTALKKGCTCLMRLIFVTFVTLLGWMTESGVGVA